MSPAPKAQGRKTFFPKLRRLKLLEAFKLLTSLVLITCFGTEIYSQA